MINWKSLTGNTSVEEIIYMFSEKVISKKSMIDFLCGYGTIEKIESQKMKKICALTLRSYCKKFCKRYKLNNE